MQVLFRGRHVFMGYFGMEEKTKETIDDEGWLHSGDIGRLDQVGCIAEGVLVTYVPYFTQDSFLYITGRIKGKK